MNSSDSIQPTTLDEMPASATKLFKTRAPMAIMKTIAVVCAASTSDSNKTGQVMRRRNRANSSAPMVPIPPASLGVKTPNEMPPRINRNNSTMPQTR